MRQRESRGEDQGRNTIQGNTLGGGTSSTEMKKKKNA